MDQEKNPILAGLIALVSVALAVGLILGVAAFAGTKVLGIGGDSKGKSSSAASLYLPQPKPTETPSNPQITLVPTESASAGDEESEDASEQSSDEASDEASDDAKKKAEEKKKKQQKAQITLQASPTSVSPGGRIDLTGIYPDGEAKILKVQRKTAGSSWQDFPVSPIAVSGGQFSTYVQTERSGTHAFRMVEVDNPKHKSNVVKVKVG